MKAIKITLGVLGTVIVIAVIVVFLVLNNLNTIIKETVETIGPEITKTDVKLNEVDIKLTRGWFALHDFSVANPTGFDANRPLLTMKEIVLHVDPDSLMDEVKVVKEIKIDGIKVIAEHKNIRDTNIQAMYDNIKSSLDAEDKAQEETAQQPDAEQMRLMIEKLNFSNSSVELVTEQWGSHRLELPSFSKTNLGDTAEGLTPKQAANEILAAYMQEVESLVKDEVETLAKSKFKNKIKKEYQKYKEKLLKKFGGD